MEDRYERAWQAMQICSDSPSVTKNSFVKDLEKYSNLSQKNVSLKLIHTNRGNRVKTANKIT